MNIKSSNEIIKVLDEKISDVFKVFEYNKIVTIKENKNDMLSGNTLDELVLKIPRKMNYGTDYVVVSLDENNNGYPQKYFPYFKFSEISSMDAVLIMAKKDELQVIHIELKSNNFNQREIYKKFVHSKNCIDFILKTEDINSVFKGNKSSVSNLYVNHRVLVFSLRKNNANEGKPKYDKFTSKESEQIKDIMYSQRVTTRSGKEVMLNPYI